MPTHWARHSIEKRYSRCQARRLVLANIAGPIERVAEDLWKLVDSVSKLAGIEEFTHFAGGIYNEFTYCISFNV